MSRDGARFKDWVLPAALERVRRPPAGADDGERPMLDIVVAMLSDGLRRRHPQPSRPPTRSRPAGSLALLLSRTDRFFAAAALHWMIPNGHPQVDSAVVHELVFGHWRYDSFIEGTHESARYHTQSMTPLMGCE